MATRRPSRSAARTRSRAGAPAPVALVTGAAKRLGREIALALARDGWNVAVHYRRSRAEAQATVREIEALGRRAAAFRFDLGAASGHEKLVADCARTLGPVACVVNSASLFEYDSAMDFRDRRFAELMRVNCAAPVRLAAALAAQLPRGVRGVVVNLLDQKLWNPNPDFLSYTLSKAALREATRLLAQALAPKVRVVGVAPGITLPSGGQTQREFERAHARTPLGRSSTPADVAAAVVYLARARAVTGTTLVVDGGQHLAASPRDVMFLTEG